MEPKERFERRASIANIIISAVSTILVLFTLFAMREDRNASLMPDISFSDVEVAIEWGETQIADLATEPSALNADYFHEHYNVNTIPELTMHNIGLGTAKDIVVQWNYSANIEALIEHLGIHDNLSIIWDDTMLIIESTNRRLSMGISKNHSTEFLLNTSEEQQSLIFPLEYYHLIREALIRLPDILDFPPLTLDVTYTDIQNKIYTKHISITIEKGYYTTDPQGNGLCIYNIHFIEEDTMPAFGSIIIDGDRISAFSAVFAIIVSIVSMGFTTYFSMKQNEHNRNSVRPIAAIKFKDYEDRIAVNIENVGTGPMIITKLELIKGDIKSKTLISLMPDIEQNWLTYIEEVDGWTIPAGGVITLIEITPINDKIKDRIRKALSDITASVDYTDIYSTKFNETRSLKFFGRHFN